MRQFWLALIAVFAAAVGHARAAEVMTPSEIESTAKAVERGNLIYRYDQAAWHTADTMVAEVKATELSNVRGWVVTPNADRLLVTYYRFDVNEPKAVYSARYDGIAVTDRKKFEGDADRTLPPASIQLIQAQQTVRELIPDLLKNKLMFACSNARFNEVVLPPTAQGDPISVYVLTPQTENNTIPLGGHYRFDVRGGQKPDWRAFSKSCLNLAKPKKAGSIQAMFVTHLLDAQPTEIHVFESLSARVPIIVGVVPQNSIWGVTGGKITLEQRKFDAAK